MYWKIYFSQFIFKNMFFVNQNSGRSVKSSDYQLAIQNIRFLQRNGLYI